MPPRRPNLVFVLADDLGLPPSHPTLPSLLQSAGYHTALIGKWHLGFPPHFSPRGERLCGVVWPTGRRCRLFQPSRSGERARSDEAESRRIGNSILHVDGGSIDIYRTMLRQMDEGIGRVLATLDEEGIASDTLVVFTSDDGGERFSDTWPFVGRKMDLLEGGIRVPLVARWPAAIAAGSTRGMGA